MSIIYDNQDNLYIIRDYSDLQYSIEQQMGFEIGQQVQELIEEVKTLNEEYDRELSSMEHEVEEHELICRASREDIEKLIQEIENMKKIDRTYIIKKLEDIKFELTNY